MNIHQAAAYWVPAGEHRGKPLACVALDQPDYLARLAEDGAAECPKGGQFHAAVLIVVERLRENAERDIALGRTVDSATARESVALLSDRNRQVLESARAVEARKGRSRARGGARGGGNEAEAGMEAPGAASAPGTSSGTLF
jgi:hypothetical protein